jgi:hypothetical protein
MSFNNVDGTEHVTELSDDQLRDERDAIEAKYSTEDPIGNFQEVLNVEHIRNQRAQLEALHDGDAFLSDVDYARYVSCASYMLAKVSDRIRKGGPRDRSVLRRYATVVGELLVRESESG